jgi:hypothetical protein
MRVNIYMNITIHRTQRVKPYDVMTVSHVN